MRVAITVGAAGCQTAALAQIDLDPLTVAASEPAAPRIEWEAAVHDFGRLSHGALVKHAFIFTNTGNATLELSNVHPGCGCTTAGEWSRKIEPGATGHIPIQLNSSTLHGTFSRQIIVTSNDPRQPNSVLQIRGTVWKPFDVIPSLVSFVVSEETSIPPPQVVRIINNLEEPVTLATPQSSHPAFLLELKTVHPGREFEMEVRLASGLNATFTQGMLTVASSSTSAPPITLNATATLLKAVSVSPEFISLPPLPLQGHHTSWLVVRTQGTNTLTLSEPSSNLPGVTLNVQELQAGRVFRIGAQFPAGFQLEPGQPAEVTFKSDHPRYPLVRVPVAPSQTPSRPQARVAPAAPPGVPAAVTP